MTWADTSCKGLGFVYLLFSQITLRSCFPKHNADQACRSADRISVLLCLHVRAARGHVRVPHRSSMPRQRQQAPPPPGGMFNPLRLVCGGRWCIRLLIFGGVACECQGRGMYALLHACVWDLFMWTHCVSAVQFLQKGVVCAFGEATLLIDKSQHAQFLWGDRKDEQKGWNTTQSWRN